jgi:serine/threonine protein phosphatase PrpC
MATAMTVLLVGEEEVTVAHVGDSRAYVWRGRAPSSGSPTTTRSSRSTCARAA